MQQLTLEQKKLRYLEYAKEREEAYRERVNSDIYKRFKNEILESIAAEASRAIQKEANAWITQYAMLEKVSVEDAIKKISKTDINEMVKRLKKYSSSDPDSPNYKFTKQMNDWMKQYNVTMRVSRAEYLMRHIDMILADSGLQTVEAINSELTRLTTDEIIRQSGILGLTVPEAKELKIMAETIASESFQTMDFSERIWSNQTNLRNRIGDGLQRSLLLGQHPTKWMQAFESLLTPAFAGSTYAMFRLAITETTRAQIKVHQVMYEKGGYTQFEFIAEPTACEVCADLDGKIFPVETMLQGFDAPPIHPHCRCSTAAYMSEEELDKLFEDAEESDSEIQLADESASMPVTLQGFEAHQKKWDTEVERRLTVDKYNHLNEVLNEIVDQSDFGMRIPNNRILKKILDDGQFKTQFETNTSEGSLDTDRRREVSGKLFGIQNISAVAENEFEKYGYLVSKGGGMAQSDSAYGYGDFLVRFKKAALIDRTTMTVGDSLNMGLGERAIAVSVKNPTASGMDKDRVILFERGLKAAGKDFLKDGVEAFADVTKSQYFELQYHGELTINDIESISFPGRRLPEGDILTRLKQLKIKIYDDQGTEY